MSKRAIVLGSGPTGGYEDAKARMKYRDLMKDYHQLKKEADVARSKLEAGKQRKMVLSAEVRFLRRRYESKILNSVQKEKSIQPLNLCTQTKHVRGLGRKEAYRHKLPPIPESKPKKKHYIGKESDFYSSAPSIGLHHSNLLHGGKEVARKSLNPFADLDQKGRTYIPKKKVKTGNITTVFDLNLNQDSINNVKEVQFPSRAPTFDLNEISTGEDFQSNFESIKFDEVKKSLTRGLNDEMQNDLMLPVCRNSAAEGPSRLEKRKISWQDPFALRV